MPGMEEGWLTRHFFTLQNLLARRGFYFGALPPASPVWLFR